MERDVKMDDITEYVLSNARPIMLWAFGIEYPKATREEINRLTDGSLQLVHRIRRKLFGRKSLEYQEKDCNFDPAVLEKDPAYLTGYFQTEKYFSDIAKQVREAFVFSDKIWDGLSSETAEKIIAQSGAKASDIDSLKDENNGLNSEITELRKDLIEIGDYKEEFKKLRELGIDVCQFNTWNNSAELTEELALDVKAEAEKQGIERRDCHQVEGQRTLAMGKRCELPVSMA